MDALGFQLPGTLEDVPGVREICLFGRIPQRDSIELELLRESPRQPPRPLEGLVESTGRRRCLLVCSVLLCLSLLSVFLVMGQTVTTPLSLTLDHWQDVKKRAAVGGLEVRKGKWQTFCSAEWPTFNVGWPETGSFDKNLIIAVEQRVFAPSPDGHPDQVPYILVWKSLAESGLSWITPFLPHSHKVPPSLAAASPAPSAPPMVKPKGVSVSHLYPVLTSPRKQKQETTNAKAVISGGTEPALTELLDQELPPPYQPPANNEAEAAAQPEGADGPVAERTRSRREASPVRASTPVADSSSQALPLRTTGEGRVQYWPFSAADLYNWRQFNPPFSKDPSALTNLIESVLVTHQPTWDDCQQLLGALLTSEEKQRVENEARKAVLGDDGRPTQDVATIDAAFPLKRPGWDYHTEAGRGNLRSYRQLLVAGLRAAARRPTNLAQLKQVIQGGEETPSAFLERLKEAYRMYTPFNPDDETQATSLCMSFIWQSYPDIKAKLQRLDGLQGYSIQDLLKEAEKIFNKRETPEEREEKRWQRQQKLEKERDKKRDRELTRVLAVVQSGTTKTNQGPRKPSKPRVAKNQCAYCKEIGHWVRDCPKKKEGKEAKILSLE